MAGETEGRRHTGDPLTLHLSRVGVGIVAGFVVALVKAAADDTDFASKWFDSGIVFLVKSVLGYALVPMILGAVGGWISDETFWVAISAPVIIAAAASSGSNRAPQVIPVGKAGWNFEQIFPVTSAYADEAVTISRAIEVAQVQDPFVGGFKAFFGIGRDSVRYRVVVASINDFDKAQALAVKLNSLNVLPAPASVGERKIGNDYYPVVVDGWFNSFQSAKPLRDKISTLDLGLPDPPYISLRDY